MSSVRERAEGLLGPEQLGEQRNVIRPPEYQELERPVVFLAGPVSGAPEWHPEAISEITALTWDVTIANPNTDGLPMKVPSAERTEWEIHHLKEAAAEGSIMFWLPKRVDAEVDDYAKTSRLELGMWIGHASLQGSRMNVGIEPGFPDEKTIRRYLGTKCPDVPIAESLAETCEDAVRVAANGV